MFPPPSWSIVLMHTHRSHVSWCSFHFEQGKKEWTHNQEKVRLARCLCQTLCSEGEDFFFPLSIMRWHFCLSMCWIYTELFSWFTWNKSSVPGWIATSMQTHLLEGEVSACTELPPLYLFILTWAPMVVNNAILWKANEMELNIWQQLITTAFFLVVYLGWLDWYRQNSSVLAIG